MKQKKIRKPILCLICLLLLVTLLAMLAACSTVDKKWQPSSISSHLTYSEQDARQRFATPTSTKLAENGVADCVVEYAADADETLVFAAQFFAETLTSIFKSTNVVQATVQQGATAATIISLGNTLANQDVSVAEVRDDGYAVLVENGKISIKGLTDAGSANGVYGFLEDRLEVMFVSDQFDYIPYFPTVYLNNETYTDNPTFAWRRMFQYETLQNNWYRKLKNNGTQANGSKEGVNAGWGSWCHNVFEFVSPDLYFDTHPEYFAEIDGVRAWKKDGNTTQLCLTAPGIIEVIKGSLAKKIEANPEATYWDFSINDNYHHCRCENCKNVLLETGSMMGTMLPIINALAEAFPDKIISTLAYYFNSDPPKGMTCHENVNITIAPIATGQAYSYLYGDTNESQRAKKMVEQWSNICQRILIWDYVVNFSYLLMPYPNYDVQPLNHEFYELNNVKAIFHQGSREKNDEMATFRSYILSRQLWNRQIDWQAVAGKYLSVYYEEAAPFVAEYLDTMSKTVAEKAKKLDLYDSPESHSSDYLSVKSIELYTELITRAQQAVADKTVVLERLEQIEINILYAKMYEKSFDFDGKDAAVKRFSKLVQKYGVERPYEGAEPTMQEFLTQSYPEYLESQKDKQIFIIVLPIVAAALLIGFNILLVCILKRMKKKALAENAHQNKTGDNNKFQIAKRVDDENSEDHDNSEGHSGI